MLCMFQVQLCILNRLSQLYWHFLSTLHYSDAFQGFQFNTWSRINIF